MAEDEEEEVGPPIEPDGRRLTRCADIRPQIEKLWAEIRKNLQHPWRQS